MKPYAQAMSFLAQQTGESFLPRRLPGGKIAYNLPLPSPAMKSGCTLPLPIEEKKEKKEEEVIDLPEDHPKLIRETGKPSDKEIEEFINTIPPAEWDELVRYYDEGKTILDFTEDHGITYGEMDEYVENAIIEEFDGPEEPEEAEPEMVPGFKVSTPIVLPKVIDLKKKEPSEEGEDENLEDQDAEEEVKGPKWAKDTKFDDSNKFRLSAQRYFLTYKSHLPKDALVKLFHEIAEDKKNYKKSLLEVVTAHEIGRSSYEHTHVYVNFGFTFQASGNPRIFDISMGTVNIHPHIKTIQYNLVGKTMRYISKQDPELADIKAKFAFQKKAPFQEKLAECQTPADVCRMATNPCQVNGLLAAFKHLKRDDIIDDPLAGHPFRLWQLWLTQRLKKSVPWGNRCPLWIYDPTGRCGKNTLKRYFLACNEREKKLDYAYVGGGKPQDVSSQIKGWLDKGWTKHCIIFDLARNSKNRNHEIYTVIEETLDGTVNVQKYQSEIVALGRQPWVVVFANFMPKTKDSFGEQTMSLDRWNDVWEITWDYIKHPEGPSLAEPGTLPSNSDSAGTADIRHITLKYIEDGVLEKDEEAVDNAFKMFKKNGMLEKETVRQIINGTRHTLSDYRLSCLKFKFRESFGEEL